MQEYDYDTMHLRFYEVISGDVFLCVPLIGYLVFSFGNIDAANEVLDLTIARFDRHLHQPLAVGGPEYMMGLCFIPKYMHLLGRSPEEFAAFYKIAGITAPEMTKGVCAEAAESTPLFRNFGEKSGLWCLESSYFQIRAIQFHGGFLPKEQAHAFAETLPSAVEYFDLGRVEDAVVNIGQVYDV